MNGQLFEPSIDRMSGGYTIPDSYRYIWTNVPTDIITRNLSLPEKSVIVDVGCGSMGHMIHGAGMKRYNCIGFDANPLAIIIGFEKKRAIMGNLGNHDNFKEAVSDAIYQRVEKKIGRELNPFKYGKDRNSQENEKYFNHVQTLKRNKSHVSKVRGFVASMDTDEKTHRDFCFENYPGYGFDVFPDYSVDGVILANSINWSYDVCKLLTEISRILRTGGEVVIYTFNQLNPIRICEGSFELKSPSLYSMVKEPAYHRIHSYVLKEKNKIDFYEFCRSIGIESESPKISPERGCLFVGRKI